MKLLALKDGMNSEAFFTPERSSLAFAICIGQPHHNAVDMLIESVGRMA